MRLANCEVPEGDFSWLSNEGPLPFKPLLAFDDVESVHLLGLVCLFLLEDGERSLIEDSVPFVIELLLAALLHLNVYYKCNIRMSVSSHIIHYN